ncbi:putative transporter ATP-binding cassette domain protein, partial [Gregarina niphandrodes]
MQLYFGVATFGCCLISTALLCMAAENQLKRIGHSYMASIMRQDMEWFDGQDSGKLAARISESMVAIRKGYGAKLAQMWFFLAMFFGGYIIALIRNWKISLVVSSCLPLMGLATMGFFWFFSRNDKLQRESYEESASILEETLLALRTVVSFGLESRTIDLFSRSLDSVRKQVLFSCIAIGGTFGAIFGVFYWSEALGFWYGAKLIADDITKYGIECFDLQNNKCMTGGTVLSVFFIVITSMFSIGQCAPCLGNLTEAMGCVNSLRKVIERQSKIVPNDINLPDFEQVTGDIELRNVKFHYPNRPDTSVYENLNLKIPAGKSIALVGESGCGKSTIVQLLERYYDITEGQLLVDGIELRERNLQSFRKYVALVSQEPRLFATSILENIRAGRTTASDEECYQAAKQANAHNFITEFPKKYHTFVGEGGGQLSGGQKQRIAIARAILRDPSILILDEATSALDNESEKIVQDALDKLVEMKKRTTIIIAHRLTTIRRADMIAVFEKKGQAQGSVIAELGTHDELMSIDNGIYRQLVQAQTLKNVEEAAEIAETIEDLPARSSSIANMVRKYSSRNSRSHSKTRFGSRLGSKFGSKNGSRLSRLGSKDEQDGAGGGGCFGIGTKKTTAAAAEEPMKVVPLSRQMKLLKEHPMLTLGAAVGAVCDGCAMPVYVILF